MEYPFRLNLRLSASEREGLEKLADERNLSMSETARAILFGSPPTHRHRRSDTRRPGRTARAVSTPRKRIVIRAKEG